VEQFLRVGLSVDALNERGWSPLFSAVWRYHYSPENSPARDLYRLAIRRLLQAGSDPNLKTASTIESTLLFPALVRTGQTVLIRALMGVYDLDAPGMYLAGDPELVAELLSLPTLDVNLSDDQGLSALHHAIALGRLDYVARLLARGADPNQVTARGESALDLAAASQERLLFVPSLIRAGGRPSSLTLARAMNALTSLDRDTLGTLEALSARVDVNPLLQDAVRLSYRLATQRGIRQGALVMELLTRAPSFSPRACAAWDTRDLLISLMNSRYAEIYRDTLRVLEQALTDLKKPEACSG
jgi:hypothetical protein